MGCGLEDRNITDRYEAMFHGFERALDKCAENHPPFIEIDPKTVGQYIGLRDKNKQEIYSDDLAKYGMDKEYVSTVTFRDGSIPYHTPGFILDCGTKYGHGISRNIIEVCSLEIIGNIHDNPTLLTQ